MKATIVNTVENTTKVVELPEAVADLAGLKRFLDINEGQFFEGTTHTDLTSDMQSIPELPESRRERGYVFFVSPAQNKFKNGAYSRQECYALIKERGLADAVKRKYGKNFTQVKTDELNNMLTSSARSSVSEEPAPVKRTSATSSPQDKAGISTEKELWMEVLKVLTSVQNMDITRLEPIAEGVDNVFPNPYSVQDLANMRK